MKKNIIYIICFFYCFSSWSQSVNTNKKSLIKTTYSVESIAAYQEQSSRKIKDFYEYLNLLSQKNISEELKNEIKVSLYLLVKNNNIFMPNIIESNSQVIPLKKFIKLLKNKELTFKVTKLTSSIVMGESWINDYTLEIISRDRTSEVKVEQIVYFYPQTKSFGDKTKKIWEIKLGEVKKP